jgi:hypothetical protein
MDHKSEKRTIKNLQRLHDLIRTVQTEIKQFKQKSN